MRRTKGLKGEGGSTASDTLGSYANRSRLEHQRAAKYSWSTRSFGDDRSVVDEFLMRAMNLMANQSRNYRRRRNCRISTWTSSKKLKSSHLSLLS